MNRNPPISDEDARLIIEGWIALRAGALDHDQEALLERHHPDWRCDAATLIAEGILAYVTVEMVEPELALNHDGQAAGATSADDLIARLAAHMLDFVDYRGDLERLFRLIGR